MLVSYVKQTTKVISCHQNIVLSVLASLRSEVWWWNPAKRMLTLQTLPQPLLSILNQMTF